MAGKICTGIAANNAGAARIGESKAFSEGIYHRAQGTALAFPVTDNPHLSGGPDSLAWIRGWTVANDASPGAIAQTSAPCVAIPQNAIAA